MLNGFLMAFFLFFSFLGKNGDNDAKVSPKKIFYRGLIVKKWRQWREGICNGFVVKTAFDSAKVALKSL
jgi:hypothetical protein